MCIRDSSDGESGSKETAKSKETAGAKKAADDVKADNKDNKSESGDKNVVDVKALDKPEENTK